MEPCTNSSKEQEYCDSGLEGDLHVLFYFFAILCFAYLFGDYPWMTSHIPSPSNSKLLYTTGKNRNNFFSVSSLPTECYLQSKQLVSILQVLVLATTECFVQNFVTTVSASSIIWCLSSSEIKIYFGSWRVDNSSGDAYIFPVVRDKPGTEVFKLSVIVRALSCLPQWKSNFFSDFWGGLNCSLYINDEDLMVFLVWVEIRLNSVVRYSL